MMNDFATWRVAQDRIQELEQQLAVAKQYEAKFKACQEFATKVIQYVCRESPIDGVMQCNEWGAEYNRKLNEIDNGKN